MGISLSNAFHSLCKTQCRSCFGALCSPLPQPNALCVLKRTGRDNETNECVRSCVTGIAGCFCRVSLVVMILKKICVFLSLSLLFFGIHTHKITRFSKTCAIQSHWHAKTAFSLKALSTLEMCRDFPRSVPSRLALLLRGSGNNHTAVPICTKRNRSSKTPKTCVCWWQERRTRKAKIVHENKPKEDWLVRASSLPTSPSPLACLGRPVSGFEIRLSLHIFRAENYDKLGKNEVCS